MAVGDTSNDNDILVYDPSVDIWSSLSVPQSSINSSSTSSWTPCRAAVHKGLVYLIGNRQITIIKVLSKFKALIIYYRDNKLSNEFYKLDLNNFDQGLLHQDHYKDIRSAPSFTSCEGYLYMIR